MCPVGQFVVEKYDWFCTPTHDIGFHVHGHVFLSMFIVFLSMSIVGSVMYTPDIFVTGKISDMGMEVTK